MRLALERLGVRGEQAGICREPPEADYRPRTENQGCRGRERDERSPEAPGEQEPEEERPDKKLQRDREAGRGACKHGAIAEAPYECDRQDQQAVHLPERQRVQDGERRQESAVATPVPDRSEERR